MNTPMDNAREDHYCYHLEERLLKDRIQSIKEAVNNIADDLHWIRKLYADEDYFDMCESIDIIITKENIECSAWNDYTGKYMFEFEVDEEE